MGPFRHPQICSSHPCITSDIEASTHGQQECVSAAWTCSRVILPTHSLSASRYNATLGQIPDDPAVVAAPFCPIDMEHGPLPQLFSRPGQTEILPLLELPASVVEDVLRHGMKPAGEFVGAFIVEERICTWYISCLLHTWLPVPCISSFNPHHTPHTKADAEARWSALNQRTGPRRARISWQQQPIIGRQGGTQ